MQNRVFILDNDQQPVMLTHPARARQLPKAGEAAVYSLPFTIVLKHRQHGQTQLLQLNLEPGAKSSLRNATTVNTTRWALLGALKQFGMPVECESGGQTRYNKAQQGYTKQHWLDAVCVGASGVQAFVSKTQEVPEIKAMGRGIRQMCRMDRCGFPRTRAKIQKRVRGFQTGDMVQVFVEKGKNQGRSVGRVAIRTDHWFNIKTRKQTVQGESWKKCRLLHRNDGYHYSTRKDSAS